MNGFEWAVLLICFVLIAALMNMFPACRWLAKKKLGISDEKDGASES
ncbi:MAG: hypothetical protein IJ268_03235 [Proteobacteria bacterium]|nr:hypothetical protein [Pseudomonadota bacterium]MBQ9242658.1 hypothetical protein [Pseudomonadota bacterium]